MNAEQQLRELAESLRNVAGWLTNKEAHFLYTKAKECSGRGVIVEIGSFKGKSTICLAKGSKTGKGEPVYAIDPHTGSEEHREEFGNTFNTWSEFQTNLKNTGVEKIVIPLRSTSQEVVKEWRKPVEFLFIDASHDYEDVKADFLSWFPLLIPGGTIALHDTTASIKEVRKGFTGWPGPRRVTKEYLLTSKNLIGHGLVDTISYARKLEGPAAYLSFYERIRLRLKYMLPDFVHCLSWRYGEIKRRL